MSQIQCIAMYLNSVIFPQNSLQTAVFSPCAWLFIYAFETKRILINTKEV